MSYKMLLRRPVLNNLSKFHLGVASQVCNFSNQRKIKRYRHPEEDKPAVEYLKRILLATGFELYEAMDQEKKLRESLTSRELELRGLALRDITIDTNYLNLCTGSRAQVEVKLIKSSRLLGGPSWRTGTLVTLQYSKNGNFEKLENCWCINGMIAQVDSSSLTVRFDSFFKFLNEYFIRKGMDGELRLIKQSEKAIYTQQSSSLKKMLSSRLPLELNTPSGIIFDTILKNETNRAEPQIQERKEQTVTILNPKIRTDPSKMRALDMISECHPLTLIHGPPGTGKTTTLAAAVLSAVLNGDKVLVTASSHAACDAFTIALAKYWPSVIDKKFVRLGNPLRFPNKEVGKYSVDNLKNCPELEKIQDELAFTRRQLIDQFKGKADIIAEQHKLNNDYFTLMRILEDEAIEESSVVICTVLQAKGNLSKYFRRKMFDLFVIDEAGFTAANNILPMIKHAPRLLMAGDHCQLPPITNTEAAQKLGLGVSLFEIMAKSAHKQICLLETQYRSNELICGWSSKYFYKNRIKSSTDVKDIILEDLLPETAKAKAVSNPLLDTPLLFISTHEQDNWIEDKQDDESVSNCDEAIFVAELVEKFVYLGISQDDICVITPYWAQIMLIRSLLYEGVGYKDVEVRTVDGFQGREKQLVIISMVRSNSDKDLGFLTETRRINTSVTRAQRCCIIVGNASMMRVDAGLASLINYCKENDSFCTVQQFYNTISRI